MSPPLSTPLPRLARGNSMVDPSSLRPGGPRPQQSLIADPQLTTLITLIRSRHPVIYVQTSEEQRVIQTLHTWSLALRGNTGGVYRWSCTTGHKSLTPTRQATVDVTEDPCPPLRSQSSDTSLMPSVAAVRSEDI